MILAVPAAGDVERLPIVAFRVRILSTLELCGAEVHKVFRDCGVPRTVHYAIERKDPHIERVGVVVVPGVEVCVGKRVAAAT